MTLKSMLAYLSIDLSTLYLHSESKIDTRAGFASHFIFFFFKKKTKSFPGSKIHLATATVIHTLYIRAHLHIISYDGPDRGVCSVLFCSSLPARQTAIRDPQFVISSSDKTRRPPRSRRGKTCFPQQKQKPNPNACMFATWWRKEGKGEIYTDGYMTRKQNKYRGKKSVVHN